VSVAKIGTDAPVSRGSGRACEEAILVVMEIECEAGVGLDLDNQSPLQIVEKVDQDGPAK
jgi:hypothetical protein